MLPSRKTLYVRATSLMGFEDYCRDNGVDAVQELMAVDIDPKALSDFTRIFSLEAFNKLMLRLSARIGDENIGLDLALRAPHNLNNMGPLAVVLKLGETTGECVANAIRYIDYLTNGLDIRIVRHPEQGLGEFRYTPMPPMANTRHMAEHAMATARSAMKILLMDEKVTPKRVTFRHAASSDTSRLEKHLGCPVDFESDTNSLFFDMDLLDIETMGTDEQVAQIVYSYLDAEIQKLSKDLTVEQLVETTILQLLPSGHCSMDLVSKTLGMHRKSLQRALRDEGTTYSEVLERKRLQTAVQLLTETKIPINRIGQNCGYSSATAFNLAFKKWKDETPQSYRDAHKL